MQFFKITLTLKLGCADRSFSEMSAVVEFRKSPVIFTIFRPIWPILAGPDRSVRTSFPV